MGKWKPKDKITKLLSCHFPVIISHSIQNRKDWLAKDKESLSKEILSVVGSFSVKQFKKLKSKRKRKIQQLLKK